MSDTVTTLGEMLAALRHARGLTMASVIASLRVPRSTAYWWESRRGRPDPEQLQRLLDLYQATPEERLRAWELRTSDHPLEAPTAP